MASQNLSFDNMKRRAKQLAREQGCKLHIALDLVAAKRGFANFKDAVHKAANQSDPIVPSFSVLLRQWWRNSKTGESGTEVLTVSLAQPATQLLKPHYLRGYFGGCDVADEGTINLHIGSYLEDNPEYAQRRLRRAARALQFMEITGLRPSRSNRCYPRSDYDNRPPIADHDQRWYHPANKKFVLSTEPYPGRADRRKSEMAEWCAKHEFEYAQIDSPSIYGHGTELYLACKAGSSINLLHMAAELAASPLAYADS
ncbi:hypothetical protein D0Z70_08310 [Sphingobium terrigena]|uniref:Uncharacterized protein n=1 Tax=Sphingobium terrigena TaxID=2304063 RepID=A0A418YTN2_9SPHN|nr:hypothetical protein [Sphingobium terrigena]RJG55403.1 hypothetical protein D0Z70_08310 [Sphingobium terrigena]